jgi:hypothetical protein
MAKQQSEKSGSSSSQNGKEDTAAFEKELASYLQQRIKPGLNSGAIPLLARSIAHDIANREELEDIIASHSQSQSGGGGSSSEDKSESGEQNGSGEEEQPLDFEAEMHDLQSELGEDWILRFSVQGEDEWLTAEKNDGSQRIEAPTAAVLSEAVALINEGGGRSSD